MDEITRRNDRPLYVGNFLGTRLPSFELGFKVSKTGYVGIVRKIKCKRKTP